MYLAIQAQNIAEEKRHHNYYRLYKRRVKSIMRRLSRRVRQGEYDLIFYGKCGKYALEYDVLQQISKELTLFGYNTLVTETSEGNGYKLLIFWNHKENKNE